MYIKRKMEEIILRQNNNFPVILVTGPRQVGKSTLLNEIKEKDRSYVTLDDPIERQMAINQPMEFIKIHKPPVIIDEIQYAPQLFYYIKMEVDKINKDGMYWITGSQVFKLMKNVGESLAGRSLILRLQGLSQSEENYMESSSFPDSIENYIQKKDNNIKSFERILRGSFPRVVTHEDISLELFYGSYVSTWLERDVAKITNILDSDLFLKFVRILATRTGQELNLSEISKIVGIDSKTVDRWIDILITSGMVYKLQSWSKNISKRMIKRPKLYFLDTGILCYLLGINSVESLKSSVIFGNIYETYVVSEILKTYWNNGLNPQIFYYRDTNRKEIDLIIEKEGKIFPFEIKTSHSCKNPYKNFTVLDEVAKDIEYGGIIYEGDKIFSNEEKMWWIPSKLI